MLNYKMHKPMLGGKKLGIENNEHVFQLANEEDIESLDNIIYFYNDVDIEPILKLNRQIKILEKKFLCEQISRGLKEPTPIYLHINSTGGFIFDGLSAMDEIINCKVPIYTVVDGMAASAATFLSVVGKKRFIKRHSFMLIHQPSSNFWGSFEELKDHNENMNLIYTCIRKVYMKYTKVTEEDMQELLKHDLWWDAQRCLDSGLVDEIL